jgi:hypothetical protein
LELIMDEQTTTHPLDALIGQVDAKMTEGQQALNPEGAVQAEPEQSAGDALTGLLTAGREMAIVGLDIQSPKVTLADDKIAAIVQVTVPVLEKYGFKLGAGLIPVELQLLFTAGPILWVAAVTALQELAAKRAKAESEARLARAPIVPMGIVADGLQGQPNG